MRLRKRGDARQIEITQFVAEALPVRPAEPTVGRVIFNTTTGDFEGFNGIDWVVINGGPVVGDSGDFDPSIGFGLLGDTVLRGTPLTIVDFGGVATLKKASAAADATWEVAGLALIDGNAGQTITYVTGGLLLTDPLVWDAAPDITQVGEEVFLSDNAGKLTLNPPTTVGHRVLRLGTVTDVTGGLVQVSVDQGTGIIL